MKFLINSFKIIVLITVSLNVSGKVEHQKQERVDKAVCVLSSPFTNINGIVTFDKDEKGVLVSGKITGLTPGPHALHIHERGDIRDPKCSTVGEHFNPFSKQHGAREDNARHVGDLGNINADHTGTALFSFNDKILVLEGPNSIIGRSLVIHANIDDLGRTQDLNSKLTGAAGERLICGVIGYG
ncbi:superoxide dismutase [Cu-Zn]-like [Coccinella septempunctata]|uniref:superoxide dismutase [Cu-Zn]-like n=1 Tax=Coccinella septempunctata TaxID=41139 RepID=UPI001D082DC2|nr:superoxide dismutase [Cu-Zn]-like [Coccinella septempunctata]